MNRPPAESKRVPVAMLRSFTADCLKAAGLRADHADQLAELLSNSDLRGVRSHGTRAMVGYCGSLRDGTVNPNPDLRVLQDTETTVLIDGDGGLGYAPMMLATEKAIEKAKQYKVALGAACHHGHYGSAGHYVRRAMQEGCCAFSVQGHHPNYFGEGRRQQGPASRLLGQPATQLWLPVSRGAAAGSRRSDLHLGRLSSRPGIRRFTGVNSAGFLQVDGLHRLGADAGRSFCRPKQRTRPSRCPAVVPRWQWRPDHRHGHRCVRPARRLPRWR